MSVMDEKTVPSIQLGGGGLSGLENEPMGTDPRGYQPEPSVTGPAKGPMVPATLPEAEIIKRIEQGRPMSAPGDPTREQMRPARGRPRRVIPVKHSVLITQMMNEESGWVPKQSILATALDFLLVLWPGNWLDLAITIADYHWHITHPVKTGHRANFFIKYVYPVAIGYLAMSVTIKQERLLSVTQPIK